LSYLTRAMTRSLGNTASREQRTSLADLGLLPSVSHLRLCCLFGPERSRPFLPDVSPSGHPSCTPGVVCSGAFCRALGGTTCLQSTYCKSRTSARRIPILIINVVSAIRCVAAGALTGSIRVHAAACRRTRFGRACCCSASRACCSTSATSTSCRSTTCATSATTSRAATAAATLCQGG
jgi:hypothetical protein